MKKLLFLLMFPVLCFGQKEIYRSYSEAQQTYFLAFYDDGSIIYQSSEYDYIDDKKINRTFSSTQDFKDLISDMKLVSKSGNEIKKDNYTIKKAAFGSVSLNIKGISKTYTFSKYGLKEFEKSLKNY